MVIHRDGCDDNGCRYSRDLESGPPPNGHPPGQSYTATVITSVAMEKTERPDQ